MTRSNRSLAALVFPDTPRHLAGRRAWKISLRALHVLCAGVFTGAYVFDADAVTRAPWGVMTVASGFAILLLDLHESGAFLLQVRGLVVMTKITVVAALPWYPPSSKAWVLAAIVLVSVVFSHAPSKVRYRVVLWSERVHGARSSG